MKRILSIGFVLLLLLCFAVGALGQTEAPAPQPAPSASARAGMELVLVAGGCYKMGDIIGDGYANERPVHEVCVKDFYIGKYMVTEAEWKSVMGSSPSQVTPCGGDCPVVNVSWHDAQAFLQALNQRTARKYRLPTEAEWEYAARSGGKNEKWAGTNSLGDVLDYAWVYTNSSLELHPVGQKKPNGLGLYDMSGDAWEWIADRYDLGYYVKSPKRDPQGPATGELRCARGGYWGDLPRAVRLSRRIGIKPDTRADGYGFRLAASAP